MNQRYWWIGCLLAMTLWVCPFEKVAGQKGALSTGRLQNAPAHLQKGISPTISTGKDVTSGIVVGGYPNAPVYAIAVSGSDAYVGGAFTMAGGVTVNHIAKWDGIRWLPLGLGLNDT
ncbi:MAG: hypothetical protein HGB19_11095, partial [Chlorobiales bacterium]|nr:hypothetical protein [Chlorobiales bacterium]